MQAISAWRDNSGFGRAQLVKQYFLSVEGGMQHPSMDYQALSGPLACTKREMTERLPPQPMACMRRPITASQRGALVQASQATFATAQHC